MKPRLLIGVIGAGQASAQAERQAYEVGRRLAERHALLVCGGLGGVMAAACRGSVEAGGDTLGLLPGADAESANPWVTIPVATNMGHARNVIIAHTARALIAVEGEYGTLSEIAVALKLGRPVVVLGRWNAIPGVLTAQTPQEAVDLVFQQLAKMS